MLFHKPAIHAIYVLCYLSRQDQETVVSAARIAEAMEVPPEQAAKVLQVLQAAGLVQAIRGRAGGYRLARQLSEISTLEVIDALAAGDEEERLRARQCPIAGDRDCTAHHGMVNINERVRALLANESLDQLLGHPCCGDEQSPVQLTSSPTTP